MGITVKKGVCLWVLPLLIGACTSRFATNGETIYQQSKNGETPVIQSPLTADRISRFYDLPQVPANPAVNIEPPVGAALAQ